MKNKKAAHTHTHTHTHSSFITVIGAVLFRRREGKESQNETYSVFWGDSFVSGSGRDY
jgi:uncharacterized membrane protein